MRALRRSYILVFALVCSHFIWRTSLFAEGPPQPIPPQLLQTLRQAEVPVHPLSSRFTGYAREAGRIKRLSFEALVDRYEDAYRLFKEEFSITTSFSPLKALESFSGELHLVHHEVFTVPFLLVAPLTVDWSSVSFFKREHVLDGKRIEELLVRLSVPKSLALKPPNQIVLEPYMATVNARIFGFEHVQLASELSSGVFPSPRFHYNKYRDWSEHQRLRKNDIIETAVRLTNYAHPSGDRYLISAHPDVALGFRPISKKTVVMTFFLWEKEPKPQPDFIYTLEYMPIIPE